MANGVFKWDKHNENIGIFGFGGHLGRHIEYLIFSPRVQQLHPSLP